MLYVAFGIYAEKPQKIRSFGQLVIRIDNKGGGKDMQMCLNFKYVI